MGALGVLEPFFVPICGGLVIGTLSVGELALTGKVLGISGVVKGLVAGNWQAWRFSLLAGLIAGGAALCQWYPHAFDPASTLGTLSTLRLVTAGFLVGLGAALGNGCTSGHGISGNARLSVRSLAATLTFMVFGVASASFFDTASLQGVPPQGLIHPPPPSAHEIAFATRVLGSAIILVSGAALAARDIRAKWLELAVDFCTGLLFALGLGVAGMTRPSKVSSFLGAFSGTFDPSLIFVMGSALLVAIPGFQFIMHTRIIPKPLLFPNTAFNLPSSNAIDWKLLVGSSLFGVGWGLAGLCPGPSIVNLATLRVPSAIFFAALTAGMMAAKKVEKLL